MNIWLLVSVIIIYKNIENDNIYYTSNALYGLLLTTATVASLSFIMFMGKLFMHIPSMFGKEKKKGSMYRYV